MQRARLRVDVGLEQRGNVDGVGGGASRRQRGAALGQVLQRMVDLRRTSVEGMWVREQPSLSGNHEAVPPQQDEPRLRLPELPCGSSAPQIAHLRLQQVDVHQQELVIQPLHLGEQLACAWRRMGRVGAVSPARHMAYHACHHKALGAGLVLRRAKHL